MVEHPLFSGRNVLSLDSLTGTSSRSESAIFLFLKHGLNSACNIVRVKNQEEGEKMTVFAPAKNQRGRNGGQRRRRATRLRLRFGFSSLDGFEFEKRLILSSTCFLHDWLISLCNLLGAAGDGSGCSLQRSKSPNNAFKSSSNKRMPRANLTLPCPRATS